MTITLERFAATGETSYIAKHNANATAIEGSINALQSQMAEQIEGVGAFTALTDTPASYSGQANKVIVVKATEDGLEFSEAASPTAFAGLTDTPADYTGAGGKKVRVNSGATELEFVADTLLSLTDTPADYAGHAGKLIVVKGDETGVEFADAGAPSAFTGLSDAPSTLSGQGGKVVRVNEAGTALELVDETVGATSFTDLGDAPSGYAGQAGRAVIVNDDETGLEFSDFAANAFTGLSDAPSDYAGQAFRPVIVNGAEDGLTFGETATPTSFIGLTDAPASYTGQGGKHVRVKADASGLEFVDGADQAELDAVGAIATAAGSAASAAQSDIDDHIAASDPHTQYQKESEKGAANGYASLDAGGLVPAAQIPAQPYDVGGSYNGAPASSVVMLRYPFPRAVAFPSGLTNSHGVAGTAATAQTDFDIQKNGVSVGTMRFAAAATTASFISASGASYAAGDVLTVVAPATPDATLSHIGFALAGVR